MDVVTLAAAKAAAARSYGPGTTLFPQQFGAKGDTRRVTDAVVSGTTGLTSATAAFTSADVGKTVLVSRGASTAAGTLSSAASASATTIVTTNSLVLGQPYLIGGTEVITPSAITGSGPYTVTLGKSNVSQSLAGAHASGETVVALNLLKTTIASVQSSTSATLAAAATTSLTGLTAWIGTDDTAAFTALAAAATSRCRVELGAACYMIPTTTITFAPVVTLRGSGGINSSMDATSTITTASTTADALVFSSPGCVLADFAIVNANLHSTPPTAGAGIRMTYGSQSSLQRVSVVSFGTNIAYDDGDYFQIHDCQVYDPAIFGISFATASGERFDHGDQSIQGCTIANRFVSYRSVATAVSWRSGGGVRFVDNKINGNEQPTNTSAGKFVDGLALAVSDGGSTSVLVVTGNSIENCTGACVSVKNFGTTGFFSKVVVVGNEIAIGGSGVVLDMVGGSATQNGSVAVITGNVFTDLSNSVFLRKWNGCMVGPNIHNTVATLVTTQTGCLNVTVERQQSIADNITLHTDATYGSSGHTGIGMARQEFDREIPTTTSSVTYAALWNVTPSQNSAGLLDLTLAGNVVGVGPFVYRLRRSFTVATGSVTIATVDTDLTTGGLFDVSFDTATASGKVLVKVKLNTAGGTDVVGKASLVTFGSFSQMRKGT